MQTEAYLQAPIYFSVQAPSYSGSFPYRTDQTRPDASHRLHQPDLHGQWQIQLGDSAYRHHVQPGQIPSAKRKNTPQIPDAVPLPQVLLQK